MDVTLKTANQHRNEWFEGVHKCKQDESLFCVMERIVKAEVHRLVVVDEENRVTGVISLSDILNYLVLRPGGDDLHHAAAAAVAASTSSPPATPPPSPQPSPQPAPGLVSSGSDLAEPQLENHRISKSESADSAVEATEDVIEALEVNMEKKSVLDEDEEEKEKEEKEEKEKKEEKGENVIEVRVASTGAKDAPKDTTDDNCDIGCGGLGGRSKAEITIQ